MVVSIIGYVVSRSSNLDIFVDTGGLAKLGFSMVTFSISFGLFISFLTYLSSDKKYDVVFHDKQDEIHQAINKRMLDNGISPASLEKHCNESKKDNESILCNGIELGSISFNDEDNNVKLSITTEKSDNDLVLRLISEIKSPI